MCLAYEVALQETSYDKDKEEFCCAVVVDSYSFIKRLPFASCFHLALTTLVSIAACYLGKELVFPRRNKCEFALWATKVGVCYSYLFKFRANSIAGF